MLSECSSKPILILVLIIAAWFKVPVYSGLLSEKELDSIYSNPWITLASILSEDIQTVIPSKDYHSFNDAIQITHFVPPGKYLLNFFNKEVSSIDYLLFDKDPRTYTPDMGHTYKLSFFVMYFIDSSYITFIPKRMMTEGPMKIADQMLHLGLATKSETDLAHSLSEINPITLDRTIRDYSPLATGNYIPRVSEFHINMCFVILNHMIATVQSNPSYLQKAQHGITLIFLGCAQGVECFAGRARLRQKLEVPVTVCGIDINRKLIEAAKTKFPDISFHVEDAARAGKIIKQFTENENLVIVVAQGLLSHEVMTGSYPALQVFQQVAESGSVDMMYVTAYGMPLFNRHTIETAGWNMEIQHIPHDRLHDINKHPVDDEDSCRNQIRIMTPMSLSQQANLFLRQSRERNKKPESPFTTLDLSMSSHPDQLFSHLKACNDCKNVRTVDLSWSMIPADNKRDRFFSELEKTEIKNIIVSGFEPWFKEFYLYVRQSNKFNIYKRTDAQYAVEIPAISTKLSRILFNPRPQLAKPYYSVKKTKATPPNAPLESNFETLDISSDVSSKNNTESQIFNKSLEYEIIYQNRISTTGDSTLDPMATNQDASFGSLDLSTLGLTNDALAHFLKHDENHKITQIDLSYSYLEEKSLDKTINLLTGFPSLKFVMASGFEPWYPAFLKAMKTQGRFKVVQRKDNKYQHELSSIYPDTAKLLRHYKTIPNQRVYAPETADLKEPIFYPPHEHETGYLSPELLPLYHQALQQLLLAHNIQLHSTPDDGHCFFHAVAYQLGLNTSDLHTVLINQLHANYDQVVTQFPAYAGEQFDQLIAELQSGEWADTGLARLLSWMFNKRVVILYFNSQSGQVSFQVYNPDGSGSESLVNNSDSEFPTDFSSNDIMLVHNGVGHWLAANQLDSVVDLSEHNQALLSSLATQVQPPETAQNIQLLYSSELIPKLLTILVLAWQAKFK